MSILGRGLDSLIPKKEETPEDPPPLDVLHYQSGMPERKYQFHVETASIPNAIGAPKGVELPRELGRKADSVFWIDVDKIEPNPEQPRRVFNVDELMSLAQSIREHGILQPLLVTKRQVETETGIDVRYQLIAGERRWRAAKLAKLREVPAIVRTAETSGRAKLELALIENVQREDLNPMERAKAFQRLAEEFGLMQKDIAERIGKSREVVTNTMRILRLPEDMQEAISANKINEGHARALLMLENNPGEQKRLFDQITLTNLNVREAETLARSMLPTSRSRRRAGLDPDSRVLQRRLEEALGTKVSLIKKGDQGRIIVEFFSDEELRGILDRIARHGE